jgi:hypothetical protein
MFIPEIDIPQEKADHFYHLYAYFGIGGRAEQDPVLLRSPAVMPDS